MCRAVPVVVNSSFFRFKCGFTIIELLVVMALALKLTRSSAIKFNDRITMCCSLDGATCNTQPGFWEEGWIIFHDSRTSGSLGVVDAGEAIIRIYSGQPPGISLRSGGNISNYVSFLSSGVARGHDNVLGNGTFRVCDQRESDSAIAVIINSAGRIRTSMGTAVCP